MRFSRDGYSSSGSNVWKLANRHQGTMRHIHSHTAYKLLGNVDVSCALDEARRREIEIHNNKSSRYANMLHHHINVAVFLTAQNILLSADTVSEKLHLAEAISLSLFDLLGVYNSHLRSFLDQDVTTYTSHDPQNELIECIYHEGRDEIQKKNLQFQNSGSNDG